MSSKNKEYSRYRTLLTKEVINPLQALSPTQLRYSESPEKWSFLQVAQHILLVEEQVLERITRISTSKKPARELGLMDSLRVSLLGLVLASPIKVKVPVPEVAPKGDIDEAELLKRFEKLQASWSQTIAQQDISSPKMAVLKHPVAGWMSFSHCMFFLRIHLQHHVRQLRRCYALAKSR